jgi:nucleoside-diphosphate-sugar epimerase
MLQGKRVVVTGATGFVGSHLAETLIRAGARVRVLVRDDPGRGLGSLANVPDEILYAMERTPADLRDLDTVRQAIAGADQVFHLGGLGSVPGSFWDPIAFVEVNVRGTAHVLEACREAEVDHLMLMSTSEVYGTAQTAAPISESHPLRPQSPYAGSKLAAEELARSFATSYDLRVTIVRSFNIFGPRQCERNVMPAIIGQALDGHTIRLGRLDSIRDYTYVTDAVDAILRLATDVRVRGRIFNLGSGLGMRVPDLVTLVGKLLDKHLTIRTDPLRMRPAAIEGTCLVADADALRAATDWTPRVAIDDGLQRMLDWVTRRPG